MREVGSRLYMYRSRLCSRSTISITQSLFECPHSKVLLGRSNVALVQMVHINKQKEVHSYCMIKLYTGTGTPQRTDVETLRAGGWHWPYISSRVELFAALPFCCTVHIRDLNTLLSLVFHPGPLWKVSLCTVGLSLCCYWQVQLTAVEVRVQWGWVQSVYVHWMHKYQDMWLLAHSGVTPIVCQLVCCHLPCRCTCAHHKIHMYTT